MAHGHFSMPRGIRELAQSLEATWPNSLAALEASGVPLNAYNNIISRSDVPMPEEVSNAFRKNLQSTSAALGLFTHVPVGSAQTRMPVLSALPVAYWVTGDTGLKQTSEAAWANKYLNIEEIAVIVPIPENVLDDSSFPIWDEVRPLMENAAGRLLDGTVFFGTNAPASFPTNVVAAAVAAGNTVNRGTNNSAAGGYVGDIGAALGTLEIDGFDANSGIASRAIRGYARAARNTQGNRYDEVQIGDGFVELDGVRLATDTMRGLWATASTSAEAIVFDRSEFVIGIRQDITYKLLDQAVIQDASGAIVFNLAQQDMVALRMTMRVGWQVANTINYDQPTEGSRYPAAVVRVP